ncbi:MAG: hypothetical protein EBZ77_06590, partial [Chitinophagia bacterium]|nr:hypothetical protein [Chitinophagia bacterium]
MATDMEQQMRNTMDKAIAEQLVPGWDREGSWDGLKHRIQPNAAPGTYRWRSAAAAAIMLLVVSVAWWWGNPQHPAAPVAEQPPVNQPLPTVQPIASEPDTQRPATTTNTLATLIRTATPAATPVTAAAPRAA